MNLRLAWVENLCTSPGFHLPEILGHRKAQHLSPKPQGARPTRIPPPPRLSAHLAFRLLDGPRVLLPLLSWTSSRAEEGCSNTCMMLTHDSRGCRETSRLCNRIGAGLPSTVLSSPWSLRSSSELGFLRSDLLSSASSHCLSSR